jgi:hypothetical protein
MNVTCHIQWSIEHIRQIKLGEKRELSQTMSQLIRLLDYCYFLNVYQLKVHLDYSEYQPHILHDVRSDATCHRGAVDGMRGSELPRVQFLVSK